jgi:hypothetical protein
MLRPAAAYQKPQSLLLEFIRILTTRCTHQTPSCSFASLSEVSTISEEAYKGQKAHPCENAR